MSLREKFEQFPIKDEKLRQEVMKVVNQIGIGQDVMERTFHLATISNYLSLLKETIAVTLKAHESMGLKFDFSPSLEVPSYLDDKHFYEDPRSTQTDRLLGLKMLDQKMINNGKAIISEEEFYIYEELAKQLGHPLSQQFSFLGGILFKSLDEFDRTGAVVDGIRSSQISTISLRDANLDISLCRPVAECDPDAHQIVGLRTIDKWRLSQLSVVGLDIQENPALKPIVTDFMQGVVVGKLF